MPKRTKVLIVDDDSGMIETLQDILNDMGYDVSSVQSGERAIDTVRNHETEFDAVLMDIRMPGMNGVDTLDSLKKYAHDLPVIMMTAYSDRILIEKALNLGAMDVLSKPLDIGVMLDYLDKLETKADILVIDDTKEICRIFRQSLQKSGLRVTSAYSGKEGIEKVRQKKFKLIFVDMVMPRMNGLETFQAIKQIDPAARVIMMTGFPEETRDIMEQAKSENAYLCLYKPFNKNTIVKLAEKICGNSNGARV